jgi:hypothetical protein
MFFIFHSRQRRPLAGMKNEKHAMKNAKRGRESNRAWPIEAREKGAGPG